MLHITIVTRRAAGKHTYNSGVGGGMWVAVWAWRWKYAWA